MMNFLPLAAMVLFSFTVAFPEYLTTISVLGILYKLSYYGYLVLMLMDLILFKEKKIRLKKEPVWVGLYFGVLFISTVLFKGFEILLLKSLIKTAIITIIIVNFLVKYKKYILGVFFKICAWLGEIGAIVNLILIVLIPNGLLRTQKTGEPMWLYGHKNSLFMSLFISILASAILYYRRDKERVSLRTYILVGIVLVSGVLSNAGMVTVCAFLLLAFLLLLGIRTVKNQITMTSCILIPLAINVLICIFRIQNIFSFIIVDILGKSMTLSGRTMIWDAALEYVHMHPVFGVGYLFPADLYEMIVLSTTHNWIIGFLFHMGIVGVLLWVVSLGHILHRGKVLSKNYVMKILAIFMFCYMVQGITENICGPIMELRFFVFLTICCCLPCEKNVYLGFNRGEIFTKVQR